jgi:uncharacterized protein (DUF1778 family)
MDAEQAEQEVAVKRRVGRPPGRKTPHRPTLTTSARVSAEIYERFVKAAQASGRTLSAEVIQRACEGLEWEKTRQDAQAMLAKAGQDARAIIANAEFVTEKTSKTELVKELQRRGYRYVRGVNGAAWFDRGVDSITWIADPALLDDLLDRAVARTLETIGARALAKPQTKPRRKS